MDQQDDRSFDAASEEDRKLALAVLERLESDGAGGIQARLERAGEPGAIRSWVSLERAVPVSPAAVEKIFLPDELKKLQAKLGLSSSEPMDFLLERLAQVLPKVIGRLSPLGKLPSERAFKFQTSELRRKLAR
jgi:uncharacterized protein YidB (DUF937 family)